VLYFYVFCSVEFQHVSQASGDLIAPRPQRSFAPGLRWGLPSLRHPFCSFSKFLAKLLPLGDWSDLPRYTQPPLRLHIGLSTLIWQESYATAKTTARCALYMVVLKIFRTCWLRPRLLFPKFFMGFCSNRPYEYAYKTRSFTRCGDNRGTQKWHSPWIRPRSLFSENFNGLLFGWTWECICQFWSP